MMNVDEYLNYCQSQGFIQQGDLNTGWFEFPGAFPDEDDSREVCEWHGKGRDGYANVIIPKMCKSIHLIRCETFDEFKRYIGMAKHFYRTNMVKLQNRMVEQTLKKLD